MPESNVHRFPSTSTTSTPPDGTSHLISQPHSPAHDPATIPDTPIIRQSTQRLLAFTRFCLSTYNIDPAHSRFIASCLLPSNYLPLWVICETQRTPFWNHLSYCLKSLGMPPLQNISGYRMVGPKTADKWLQEWMSVRHEQPRIFIDTVRLNDRTSGQLSHKHPYFLTTTECIRVVIPALMLSVPPDGAEEELLRLLRMVLERPIVESSGPGSPPTALLPIPIIPSRPLVDLIHALPTANVELEDSETLFTSICLLPTSHAALYGRTINQLIDTDFWSMMQAVRGSIRQWVRDIIIHFHTLSKPGQQWISAADLQPRVCLPRMTVHRMLDALTKQGMLEKKTKNTRVVRYALTQDGLLVGAAINSLAGGWKWW